LKTKLKEAHQHKERVIVFNHYPLLAQAAAATHLLWNGEEIVDILEDEEMKETVVAYFCGHYHPGGHYMRERPSTDPEKQRGLHYYTMKGILEAKPGSNCFAVVEVFENYLRINGVGSVEVQTLHF
jgi:hypothetical protein